MKLLTFKLKFSPLIKDLGIVEAFDRKYADFSEINGINDLYIDKVNILQMNTKLSYIKYFKNI
jgi:serine protease inhibitor